MGIPNPEESTAIYQREFSDVERQQIKLDILMLNDKGGYDLRKMAIANRRLAEAVIRMYLRGIFQLSDDERDLLDCKNVVTQGIRDDLQAFLAGLQVEEVFHESNEK